MTSLTDQLIAVANRFGDPEYSRAGGGNASVKVDGVLYIKPSGTSLATLKADDLVPLRLDVLLDALHTDEVVGGDPVRVAAERARVGDPGGRRPSVEILFHALIPDALVLHLHPLTANALTCNRDIVSLAADLLGDEAVVVDYIDPGVPLARGVDAARIAFTARTGLPAPGITLLANHGIIVSGADESEIVERTERLTAVVREAIDAVPAQAAPAVEESRVRAVTAAVAPVLRGVLGGPSALAVVTTASDDLVRAETVPGSAMLTEGPLIPDQIVYAGSLPLVLELGDDLTDSAAIVSAAVAAYEAEHHRRPVIVVVPSVVTFAAGKDLSAARNALAVFVDALRVTRDANRLGRVRTMTIEQRSFIENWEAEAYRQSIAASSGGGRLVGKVAVVTGAAQGFGLGIATELLAEGAHVVLADLNVAQAQQEADRLSAEHQGRAVAVAVNVAEEQSQADAIAAVTALFGGLDIFVSNAGIARAGSVTGQKVSDFDLVTAINYKGYFLGVRAVTPVLALQHAARPDVWFDIIEINSKSGLEGSKRNFAYAGSKFGGIGLTQSFALELVEDGIKVNAICPGNFLDGPLWSDPDRGLFVQYLAAGKVPGATSVDDVRRFYEAKVPMNRGCLPADVAQAVFYVVAQQYETGQAIPVTGGQIMMN